MIPAPLRVALLLVPALLFFTLGRVAAASAAPVPTFADDCSTGFDPSSCERLDYMAHELSAIDANTASPVGSQYVEATLSAPDAQRLDLIWIGVFLASGIAFGTMVAHKLNGEAKGWGGGV